VFNIQYIAIIEPLNYSGLPLRRRVEHLVWLKTDLTFTAFALVDESNN